MNTTIFPYDLMQKFFDYYADIGYRTEFIVKMKEHDISEREAIIIWQSFDVAYDRLIDGIRE